MEELDFWSILLKIPIFPQGMKCVLVFSFGLEEGGREGEMEFMISLTSPCCYSASFVQHSGYDECLVSRKYITNRKTVATSMP